MRRLSVRKYYKDGDPIPRTGSTIFIPFIHNREKAPYMGPKFGQDIEPAGYYFTSISPETFDEKQREIFGKTHDIGVMVLRNHLVLKHKETGHGGWKTDLSNMFGGKKKRRLTEAVKKAGYDGILTFNKYGLSESLSISGKVIPWDKFFKE